MTSRLGAPIDVVPLLLPERAILVELLEGLRADDWERPTECPAWNVKGIALHIVGDDLSLLSRQRDAAPNSLMLWAERHPGADFPTLLNTFNEEWVDVARFFSPRVVVDLLRATGDWTHAFYASVEPEERNEPVYFAGPEPAPYWLIAAREHLERWVHQQQIRRATHRPELVDDPYLTAAASAVVRGFPAGLDLVDAAEGTTILLAVDGASERWSLHRGPDQWQIGDGDAPDADVRLSMSAATAATAFSRAMPRAQMQEAIAVEGNVTFGRALIDGLAAAFGQ
jgi:uncharacterized protein (TIGR03083 family)